EAESAAARQADPREGARQGRDHRGPGRGRARLRRRGRRLHRAVANTRPEIPLLVQRGWRRAELSRMRKLLLVVLLVVLAVPATAPAKGSGGGSKNAAKECKALRAQ